MGEKKPKESDYQPVEQELDLVDELKKCILKFYKIQEKKAEKEANKQD